MFSLRKFSLRNQKKSTFESLTQSLPEAYRSIPFPAKMGTLRRFFVFFGPAYLISAGYVDPGNWGTDIESGSRFGYELLTIVLFSSCVAVLMQSLAVRLGIGIGRDLAQICAEKLNKPTRIFLWILAELAIIATDIAEILGSALALKLLFGLPLFFGTLLTIFDVFLLLVLLRFGFRYLEAFMVVLFLLISGCLFVEIYLSKPDLFEVLKGYAPKTNIFTDWNRVYLSVGIIGATVMPHNLYLHSSIVQSRDWGDLEQEKQKAFRYANWDSAIALSLAFLVNSSILILAAASFHKHGYFSVVNIENAYELLAPILGTALASTLFAFALLLCGQSSTISGTLSGQIVMEGFLKIHISPWLRRLITRSLAISPVLVMLYVWGESKITEMIVFSQVILSLQLPFAMIPLVWFTGNKKIMGAYVNPWWVNILAWGSAIFICLLNLTLLGINFFS